MPLSRRAPAKINLGLHVLRQRPDGYHEVETVLHRLEWADTVRARRASSLSFTCSDPTLPTDEQNLCVEAADRLARAFGISEGAHLHLEKRIPHGAGLGGGSSDAAATLQLLAELWEVDLMPEQLQEIGREIGSDVPFFLQEAVAAYATGRGDHLRPLEHDGEQYRIPYSVLVLVPDERVATARAYDLVPTADHGRPDLPALVQSNDLSQWRGALQNDFEAPIVEDVPAIAAAHRALEDAGAQYVSLSGSGSAVYGVFRDQPTARAARDKLRAHDRQVHLTEGP